MTFKRLDGWSDLPAIKLPCGQCTGCKLDKAQAWSIRAVHEGQMHEENCFLTLTYSDEHLPRGLVKRDVQLFLKRLRKEIAPTKIRFLLCGEYGELTERPHYHLCLFGYDFHEDRTQHQENKQGDPLFTSAQLDRVWPKGHCLIGDLTRKSAAYVARYIVKKQHGTLGEYTYRQFNAEPGFKAKDLQGPYFKDILPPFATMSRRPGIGESWFAKYHTDVLPIDNVVIDGKTMPVPSYYDTLYSRLKGEKALELVKEQRNKKAKKHRDNNTPERLLVRQTCAEARMSHFKRDDN